MVPAQSAQDHDPGPRSDVDDAYHCPNCLFLADPTEPGKGFWACQNRCIRTL